MARSKQAASRAMRKLLRDRRKANRGDKLAEARLLSTVEQWTARANRMLDNLERHGFTKQAYESAQHFIKIAYGDDSNRFSTDLTSSKALYQQAMALNHFFTLETSTVKGSYAVQRRRIKAFREKFKDTKYSGVVKKMKNKDIIDFFDFLHDTPVGKFLADRSKYQSGDDMDSFMNAIYGLGIEEDQVTQALTRYIDTKNHEQEGTLDELEEDQIFHYDDLVKFLKGKYKVKFNKGRYKISNEETDD